MKIKGLDNVYYHNKLDIPLVIATLFIIFGFLIIQYTFIFDDYFITMSVGVSNSEPFCNPCFEVMERKIPRVGEYASYNNPSGNPVIHKLIKRDFNWFLFSDFKGNMEWIQLKDIKGTSLFKIATIKRNNFLYSCRYEEKVFNMTGLCEQYS